MTTTELQGNGKAMNHQRNCLSYWFPRLKASGLPVPKTRIVRWGGKPGKLTDMLDGKRPDDPAYEGFVREMMSAVERIGRGGPVFLRTGQGSGKHNWKRTCYVAEPKDIVAHIAELVEWSHMVDMLGLPHEVWCVRELLPVDPVAVLPRYRDMPLVKEVRAFIGSGRVKCNHPYWPPGAIREGFSDSAYAQMAASEAVAKAELTVEEIVDAVELAERVADVFATDGEWSVDLLKTRNGWYVTDMANAAESFHWPECKRI